LTVGASAAVTATYSCQCQQGTTFAIQQQHSHYYNVLPPQGLELVLVK